MPEIALPTSSRPGLRTRVAMPLPPPEPAPRPSHPRLSLIPVDLIQDLEREAKLEETGETELEPRTSPIAVGGDDVAFMAESPANVEEAIEALAEVALFKDLPRASLEALAGDAMQLELPDGESLFLEGEEAGSFFVMMEGTVELLRQKDGREVALRHVSRGEAMGLFGLFSGQQRAASARAIGDCVALVVSGERMQALLERDDDLHDRLLRFFRERLLESFMANRLFGDIDSIARARLIGRFTNKTLKAGDALLNPGEVVNLLLVVTHGSVIVEERSKLGASKQYELGTGQFLTVTCALSGLPSRLRVFTNDFATVSVLSHKDLNELMKDYPALRLLPSRLPAHARQVDRDVFCGTTGVGGM